MAITRNISVLIKKDLNGEVTMAFTIQHHNHFSIKRKENYA